MKLILASQSPRRRELLSQLGFEFSCANADIDETVQKNEAPSVYVERLAIAKAQAIASEHQVSADTAVLGSDTSVVVEGNILGKPEHKADCLRQLTLLSGKQHQVLTAVAVTKNNQTESIVVTTDVTFKPLTITEMENYWHTGEPCDKAGSYGIQGVGGQFVTQISGSYFAVVGLPLYETTELLASVGVYSPLQTKTTKAVQS